MPIPQYPTVLNYDEISFSSATTSEAFDLHGTQLATIEWPSGMTASTITIQYCSTPDGTYLDYKDKDGTSYTFQNTTSAGMVYLDPSITWGLRYIKLSSSESQSATLTIGARPV